MRCFLPLKSHTQCSLTPAGELLHLSYKQTPTRCPTVRAGTQMQKNNWNLYEVLLTNISWANIKSQETAQWCIVLCLYLICLKWLRSMTPKICIWIQVLHYQLCAAYKSFPLSKPQFPLRAWPQSSVSEYVCVALRFCWDVSTSIMELWRGWVVGLEPSSHLYPLIETEKPYSHLFITLGKL